MRLAELVSLQIRIELKTNGEVAALKTALQVTVSAVRMMIFITKQ